MNTLLKKIYLLVNNCSHCKVRYLIDMPTNQSNIHVLIHALLHMCVYYTEGIYYYGWKAATSPTGPCQRTTPAHKGIY